MPSESRVNQLRRAVEQLNRNFSQAADHEASAAKKLDAANKQLSSASPSSMQSKRQAAARCNSQLLDATRKRSELQSKVASKQSDLAKADTQWSKSRESERLLVQTKLDKKRSLETDRIKKLEQQLSQQIADSNRRAQMQGLSAVKRLFTPETETLETGPQPIVRSFDFFLSHASEDKAAIAQPLFDGLTAQGKHVWFDQAVLMVGDSLRRKIDEGLKQSSFGIVILSEHFFRKNWPQAELDALFSREMQGRTVILPIWHNISVDEIRSYSPLLADKVALKTSIQSIEEITELLCQRSDR